MKVALLSIAMMSAIFISGFGLYTLDAPQGHLAVDGYGVGSPR